jgi:two-component system response regulator RegA
VSPPTLLVVDDDEAFRVRLGRAMEARGFVVTLAASTDQALTLLTEPPEYAVIDLRMPGRSGLELLSALLAADPSTRVVVLTGYGSIPTAIDATRRGLPGQACRRRRDHPRPLGRRPRRH